mmetsp:Transcript_71288/g.230900  ORF Transcript_71288/g.230900 Transcript_71288/m.230900 type:complete len:206 (-) Transcript_71288:1026-1643(-)
MNSTPSTQHNSARIQDDSLAKCSPAGNIFLAARGLPLARRRVGGGCLASKLAIQAQVARILGRESHAFHALKLNLAARLLHCKWNLLVCHFIHAGRDTVCDDRRVHASLDEGLNPGVALRRVLPREPIVEPGELHGVGAAHRQVRVPSAGIPAGGIDGRVVRRRHEDVEVEVLEHEVPVADEQHAMVLLPELLLSLQHELHGPLH